MGRVIRRKVPCTDVLTSSIYHDPAAGAEVREANSRSEVEARSQCYSTSNLTNESEGTECTRARGHSSTLAALELSRTPHGTRRGPDAHPAHPRAHRTPPHRTNIDHMEA